MAREREHKYLIQINNILVAILSLIVMICLSFFVYWFVTYYVSFDFETIKIDLINKYGYDIFGFVLYGLRYVGYVILIFILYELFRLIIIGRKNSSFVFRIEKGDIYSRCSKQIYKTRALLTLIIPFIILGILPIIGGLIFKNLYVLLVGVINVMFNVRDVIMFIMILSLNTKVIKYEDENSKDKVVLELRKDFSNYKNILIKNVTKLEDYDNDDSLFVISKWSVLIIILFIIFILIGVFR